MHHPPQWFLVVSQLHFTVDGAVPHIKPNRAPCYISHWELRDLTRSEENSLIFICQFSGRKVAKARPRARVNGICWCWEGDFAVPVSLNLPSLLGAKGNCERSSHRREAVLLGEVEIAANPKLPNPCVIVKPLPDPPLCLLDDKRAWGDLLEHFPLFLSSWPLTLAQNKRCVNHWPFWFCAGTWNTPLDWWHHINQLREELAVPLRSEGWAASPAWLVRGSLMLTVWIDPRPFIIRTEVISCLYGVNQGLFSPSVPSESLGFPKKSHTPSREI